MCVNTELDITPLKRYKCDMSILQLVAKAADVSPASLMDMTMMGQIIPEKDVEGLSEEDL